MSDETRDPSEDTLLVLEAVRIRYAAQLRDPKQRITGADLVAAFRLEQELRAEAVSSAGPLA